MAVEVVFMEELTVDAIMERLEHWARDNRPIDPAQWMNAAMKLNALQGWEDDKLLLLKQKVAQARAEYIKEGKPVSAAKVLVEATDEYVAAKHQEAKIERVKEAIRLAKGRAKLGMEEFKLQ